MSFGGKHIGKTKRYFAYLGLWKILWLVSFTILPWYVPPGFLVEALESSETPWNFLKLRNLLCFFFFINIVIPFHTSCLWIVVCCRIIHAFKKWVNSRQKLMYLDVFWFVYSVFCLCTWCFGLCTWCFGWRTWCFIVGMVYLLDEVEHLVFGVVYLVFISQKSRGFVFTFF